MSLVFRRFMTSASTSSSNTIHLKPTPSKAHHHTPIPTSTFPKGYLLTGLHCGIKKKPGIPDLGLILSTSPHQTTAAACFTKNTFKAAPVLVSENVLMNSGGKARAVVVNSGCANAVTGKQGLKDAWAMVEETDRLLTESSPSMATSSEHGQDQPQTLVMSTGVIGQNLPISKIIGGIRSQLPSDKASTLSNDFEAWQRAARAFMTTDTFPKLRARVFTIGGVEYRMAGMDKGAGMIHPSMGPPRASAAGQLHATLLGCILTDAPVSSRSLQSALTYAVDRSFNSISVDGEMSTNDTILVLANGAAHEASSGVKVEEIDEESNKEGYEVFKKELTEFAIDLAKLVVRDGEGATKFVTVTVKNAPTYRDAHRVASRISTSALVKTALYGEDANWGRILSATGSVPLSTSPSGVPLELDPKKVSVTFIPSDGSSPLPVLINGEPEKVDEIRAKEILVNEDLEVEVDLGMEKVGEEEGLARYWTCDFSYEYVRINGDYRS